MSIHCPKPPRLKKTKTRINKGFRGFESTSSEDESNKGPPKYDPISNNKEKIRIIKRPSKEPTKPNLIVDRKPNRDEKVVEIEKIVNCRESSHIQITIYVYIWERKVLDHHIHTPNNWTMPRKLKITKENER